MAPWIGSISLPSGEAVTDLRIGVNSKPTASTSQDDVLSILQSLPTNLAFLAIVEMDNIPISLVAGPRWSVLSDNPASISWFDLVLCSDQPDDQQAGTEPGMDDTSDRNEVQEVTPWWESPVQRQSPVGVLVAAQHTSPPTTPALSFFYSRRISEIVFYAEMVPVPGKPPSIRLFAQPLSSDLAGPLDLISPTDLPSEPEFFTSPWLPDDTTAESQSASRAVTESIVLPRKRPRTNSNTSLSSASGAAGSSLISLVNPKRPRMLSDASRYASSITSHGRPSGPLHPLSRCSSIADKPDSRVTPAAATSISLAPSRQGSVPAVGGSVQGDVPIEADGDSATTLQDGSSIEAKNKDTISRIVMSGMRLYGYQPYSRSKRDKEPLSKAAAAGADEYKSMYHQVYKSVTFAMRKYMSTVPLHQQYVAHLRQVVDKLLCVFCIDSPLPLPGRSDEDPDGIVQAEDDRQGTDDGDVAHGLPDPLQQR